ncbi:MarR family winged helix-turn-helix transcriptional regulator [Streptomyces orinoci]|uniref:MarR family winged helix-turn-helix transcriptional regulator n=1 Tax=Streptomyces orinoci TaxID=67339 RepID=A0ABV3JZN8_STRON|nr:MarR family winged helix-turn-helix transcriptional regulator [Streptomyces orinoci]
MTRLDGPGDGRVAGPGSAPDTVAPEIAQAVEYLSDLWSLAARDAAPGLSSQQLRALRALEAASGCNLTALAARLDMGPPTASRLCDRLAAAGMLERTPHPVRRREVRLSLTAQGRRVLDEVAARRAQALTFVLAALEPAERSALIRGLKALFLARSRALPTPGQPSVGGEGRRAPRPPGHVWPQRPPGQDG